YNVEVHALFHVDAFASRPFEGNPAGVCIGPELPDDAWMQEVAAELRLPATAFVAGEGPARRLRWFAPATELEICWHGTVAARHVLWETESLERVEFETRAGAIAARRRGESSFITLAAGESTEAEPPPELLDALA